MSAGYPTPSPFSQDSFNQPPRKSGASWLISLLLIGLGIVFLGGVVCIAGVCYVASNIDKWVVSFGREAIVAAIEDSELPQSEKDEITTQIDRLVDAYKSRKINQADLERVFNELDETPAFKALTLYGIENDYLQDTGLTAAEVEQGRRAFQRALRGVYEGKIPEDNFFNALPDDAGDDVRLASNPSAEKMADDDLRLALAKLKLMADNARIPDEAFELDIGDEVKKIVDKALQGK
jgi:hypothetical protein